MPASSSGTGAHGPASLVQALVGTLQQEEAALSKLGVHFEQQLDALREQRPEAHEEALDGASEAIHTLGRLRATRERQMRLLGRILKVEAENVSLQQLAAALSGDAAPLGTRLLEARAAVRARAQHTRQACEHVEFALQYAVRLSREMLQVMQNLDVPPPPKVYTATGDAPRTVRSRSLLNRIG